MMKKIIEYMRLSKLHILLTSFFVLFVSMLSYAQVTLNAPNGGTGYQWYKDGVAISAATSASYSPTTAGVYVNKYTDALGCSQATAVFVLVDNCTVGTQVTLAVTSLAAGETVLWSTSAITQSINVTSTATPTNYRATVTGSCATDYNFVVQNLSVCLAITNPSVSQTSPAGTTRTGNAGTDLVPTGGTAPYLYTNGSSDPACIAPVGATALPMSSNLTINSSTGAYTYIAPNTVGTYYFCIRVCDSQTPTASCRVAVYTVTTTCVAGTVAPSLSSTTMSNVCPATTIDLTAITASNVPVGATLTWHTSTPATTANRVATPTAVSAGTYYAAFFDATNNCYSNSGLGTTVVTATASNLCFGNATVSQTSPAGTTRTGNAGTDLVPTGGTAPYIYTNGSSDPACIAPVGATALPVSSNLTINSSTGAYTYIAPNVEGTYYFCIRVCDSQTPTASCRVAVYTVTTTCVAGTTAPTLSATMRTNICPSTTIDLTAITASNMPTGASLTWHTATPATTANQVATPTAVSAGTYYAAFFDATNNCYSNSGSGTTVVTATASNLCFGNATVSQTSPAGTTRTGNAGTDLVPTGGTAPYLYTNGSSDPTCIAPVGATALPVSSNLTINSSTGAYTYRAPNVEGTYYFCIRVCDSQTPTASCRVAVYTITTTCVAGTTAPTLSATTRTNICPSTTIDLTAITASNVPVGATLTWHTATPATTANRVATPTAVTAGTYYAAFFDATNNCYSNGGSGTTVVTATAGTCCNAGNIAPVWKN